MAAQLEDLDQAGALLRSVAAQLGHCARAAMKVAADPGIALTAPRSGRTFAAAEVALGAATLGPSGLLTLAAAAEANGLAITTAAQAYRGADAAVNATLRRSEFVAGHIVGAAATPALLGAALDAGVVGVALSAADLRVGSLPEPIRRLGGLTLRLLSRPAARTEALLPTVPGMVNGVVDTVPGGQLLAARLYGRTGQPGRVGRTGEPVTVADLSAGIEAIADLAGGFTGHPWLRESPAVAVDVQPGRPDRPAAGIGELVARMPPSSAGPRIRVQRIDGAAGRRSWVISIPGTATWSAVAGRTPFDLTGDVRLMAGQPTAGKTGLVEAMRAVGVAKGEPVLLVGYSQGGLIAAAAASDPRVRSEFTVTQVLTVGSPVASMPVPDDVGVLSIEHTDDLVPRLDAASNPDRSNWVTVSAGSERSGGSGSTPLASHELDRYQRTADIVGRSHDPSIGVWKEQAAGFLAGANRRATTWDVELSRVGPWSAQPGAHGPVAGR